MLCIHMRAELQQAALMEDAWLARCSKPMHLTMLDETKNVAPVFGLCPHGGISMRRKLIPSHQAPTVSSFH